MTESPPAVVPAGWYGVIAHPGFRQAVEQLARGVVAQQDDKGTMLRWLTNDLGRMSTLVRALIIEAECGSVTLADVLRKVRRRRTASDGRVIRLFELAEASGLVAFEPRTPGARTDARMVFSPGLLAFFHRRCEILLRSTLSVAPDIRAALGRVDDDAFFRRFLIELARYDGAPPGARGPPAMPAIRHFAEAEAGLPILYDVMLAQASDRERLLQRAPLSRSALARRFQVSRQHVSRLFEAARESGCLDLPTANEVTFSARMSREAELHFALDFLSVAASARAAMTTGARRGLAGAGARVADGH